MKCEVCKLGFFNEIKDRKAGQQYGNTKWGREITQESGNEETTGMMTISKASTLSKAISNQVRMNLAREKNYGRGQGGKRHFSFKYYTSKPISAYN